MIDPMTKLMLVR